MVMQRGAVKVDQLDLIVCDVCHIAGAWAESVYLPQNTMWKGLVVTKGALVAELYSNWLLRNIPRPSIPCKDTITPWATDI